MGECYHVQSDGLHLAVEIFGAGPPLVFAHGLTGNRCVIRRQLTPLADRYRIVVYDQRGHGDSTPVTDTALYEAQRMAADMAVVMDALGIARAIIGGESMGAATALLCALTWPQRVEALLLTAPAFSDMPNPDAERVANMGRMIADEGLDAFLAQSATRLAQAGASPQAIATIAAMHRSHDPASLAAACRAVSGWVLPELVAVAGLRAPVCLIGWPNDPLHPLDLAQRLAVTFPDAWLETLPSVFDIFADPEIIGRAYRRYLGARQWGKLPGGV